MIFSRLTFYYIKYDFLNFAIKHAFDKLKISRVNTTLASFYVLMLIIIGSSNNTQTPTYTLPNPGYPTPMSEYRSAATETEVQPETNRNRKNT